MRAGLSRIVVVDVRVLECSCKCDMAASARVGFLYPRFLPFGIAAPCRLLRGIMLRGRGPDGGS